MPVCHCARRLALIVAAAAFLPISAAWPQGAVLQGGPWTPGHVPMYVGQGTSQPIVQDSGPAGGGGIGVGLSELLLVARGTGTPPYAGQGSGPFGTNFCDYDAPTTNATGYHFLCFSANAQGGGLIAAGAGGTASPLPLQFNINGTSYPFVPIAAGTPGGIAYYPTALSIGSSGAIPANAPVLGGGSGAPVAGTRSGNTTDFATVSGSLTLGHCITADAAGNLLDSGSSSCGVTITGTPLLGYVPIGNGTTGAWKLPFPRLDRQASKGGSVQVGPYPTTATGAANFGPSAGQTSVDFVTVGQIYRIRQDGTVNAVKFYLPATTSIAAAYVKIWRAQGTAYDLVGSSNISASITAGTNAITLATPIAGVLKGDYVGLRLEFAPGGAAAQNLFASVAANTTNDNVATVVYSVLSATPATSQYNWAAQTTLSGNAIIVETFMAAPVFVAIGDSLTSGLLSQTSFADNFQVTTQLYQSFPYVLGTFLSYANQNVGIGGQTTTQMAARFAADVVAKNPQFAIIMGGVNDILGGVTNVTILANFTTMLNAGLAAGIYPVVIGVLPFRSYISATNAMLQQRDLLNAALKTLVTSAPYNGLYVSPDPMGVYYSGGDPDNLWTLPYAPLDALHPSPAGYIVLAQLIYDALQNGNESQMAGFNAGYALAANMGNSFYGIGTGRLDTTGFRNTALGYDTFSYNTTGYANSVFGSAAMHSNATGTFNTAMGYSALFTISTGSNSTAFGAQALFAAVGLLGPNDAFGSSAGAAITTGYRNAAFGNLALGETTTGYSNSAFGFNALLTNKTGTDNTAVGQAALYDNTASQNTAVGSQSLQVNTTGTFNAAVGFQSLWSNTTGSSNTALGWSALLFNTTGSRSTAVGYGTLARVTTGTDNSAFGYSALNQGTGSFNDAFGSAALISSTTGTRNDAFGYQAATTITTGHDNVAFGYQALGISVTDSQNTAIGPNTLYDLAGGSSNTCVGFDTCRGLATGSNNTVLGAQVTGLGAATAGNVILSDGAGTIRARYNATNWTLSGGPVIASDATAATSTSTGSLQAGGGLGVAGAGWFGGLINSASSVTAWSGTAIPAGGTTGTCILISSTANFGICFGSNAPTLSAAKGSIYLRSDGTQNNRLYINTDGGTTWTAFATTSWLLERDLGHDNDDYHPLGLAMTG